MGPNAHPAWTSSPPLHPLATYLLVCGLRGCNTSFPNHTHNKDTPTHANTHTHNHASTQCKKFSDFCGAPCPQGMGCRPSSSYAWSCQYLCTPGGNECGLLHLLNPTGMNPFLSTWCDLSRDPAHGACRHDCWMVEYNSSLRDYVWFPGCPGNITCAVDPDYPEGGRECQNPVQHCPGGCPAGLDCVDRGKHFGWGCADLRCSPLCYDWQACVDGACQQRCGQDPTALPCPAGQICDWDYARRMQACFPVSTRLQVGVHFGIGGMFVCGGDVRVRVCARA